MSHPLNCHDLSDREIIKLSLENLAYFACLYERYEFQMRNYIFKISSADAHEAEDILQEAFIKIWTHIHDFDSNLTFKSWLYRIVHNLTVSNWRKNESRFSRDAEFIRRNDEFYEEISWEDHELSKVKKKEIHQAIRKLKDSYREVLILRYFENMSYEEISDVLKIPEGTVATRINRAKKQMQKNLGATGLFK